MKNVDTPMTTDMLMKNIQPEEDKEAADDIESLVKAKGQ